MSRVVKKIGYVVIYLCSLLPMAILLGGFILDGFRKFVAQPMNLEHRIAKFSVLKVVKIRLVKFSKKTNVPEEN